MNFFASGLPNVSLRENRRSPSVSLMAFQPNLLNDGAILRYDDEEFELQISPQILEDSLEGQATLRLEPDTVEEAQTVQENIQENTQKSNQLEEEEQATLEMPEEIPDSQGQEVSEGSSDSRSPPAIAEERENSTAPVKEISNTAASSVVSSSDWRQKSRKPSAAQAVEEFSTVRPARRGAAGQEKTEKIENQKNTENTTITNTEITAAPWKARKRRVNSMSAEALEDSSAAPSAGKSSGEPEEIPPPEAEKLKIESPAQKRGRGSKEAAASVSAQKAEVPVVSSLPARSSCQQPVILLTGLHLNADQQEILTRLGGSLVEDFLPSASHLVSDKVRRTEKFLCGFSHCQFLLSFQWLERSLEAGFFLQEETFCLQDPESEDKFAFSLSKRVAGSEFLRGQQFFATPSVVPRRETLRKVIEAAGGKFLENWPKKGSLANMKCLVAQEDSEAAEELRAKVGPEALFTVEAILTGVLRQRGPEQEFRFQPEEKKSTGAKTVGKRRL